MALAGAVSWAGIGWTMSARDAWRRASRLHEQSGLDHLADLETRLHETFPELPLPPSPDQIYGL